MRVVRAFIALELPEGMLTEVARQRTALQSRLAAVPLRWVAADQMHLTLNFLGDVAAEQLAAVEYVLLRSARRCPPLNLALGSLGVFPNRARPRVLWLGVTAPAALVALQEELATHLAGLGFPPDGRPYSPHLTLARVARTAAPAAVRSLAAALDGVDRVGTPVSGTIRAATLFRSELTSAGARYHVLRRAALAA